MITLIRNYSQSGDPCVALQNDVICRNVLLCLKSTISNTQAMTPYLLIQYFESER